MMEIEEIELEELGARSASPPQRREEVSEGNLELAIRLWQENRALRVLLYASGVIIMMNSVLTFVVWHKLKFALDTDIIQLHQNEVTFRKGVDVDEIQTWAGLVRGSKEIAGPTGGYVLFRVNDGSLPGPSLSLNKKTVELTGVSAMFVQDNSGNVTFKRDTNKPNGMDIPQGVHHIKVESIHTDRIWSLPGPALKFDSSGLLNLEALGIRITAGETLDWISHGDILLQSIHGHVLMDGRNGIFLAPDKLDILPRIPDYPYSPQERKTPQFHLCICGSNGKLFLVKVPKDRGSHLGCHTTTVDPCQD